MRTPPQAGVENVEFVKGYLEDMPLGDGTVDVVISNCVINLSGDKPQVIREAARVLRPGGRFAVSDVIADPDMDEPTRADMAAWTGCVAGALTEDEFRAALRDAGLEDDRDPRDPPRPRARRRRDHPGPQARPAMTVATCSLSARELAAQLDRYRALGRRGFGGGERRGQGRRSFLRRPARSAAQADHRGRAGLLPIPRPRLRPGSAPPHGDR